MPTSGALTGRDRELATLRRARRDGRNVVLLGPTGMGATALLDVAMEGPGRPVLRVTGSPGGRAVALAPLQAVLPAVTPDDVLARLHEALAERPIVVVDDARHLDDVTATALHQVAHAGLAPLVVVASGSGAPEGIRRLLRSPEVSRIELGPLADDVLAGLVRAWVAGPVEGRSLHRLLALAAGRPGVLRELVDGSLASGVLRHDGLVHQLHGRPTVSVVLEGQVDEVIGPLTNGQRRALELVTVAGALDLDVAADLAGAGVVVADDLDALERLGAVTASGDRLAPVDPLVAEVVRRRIGRLAQRRLNHDLARSADRIGLAARGPHALLHAVTWAHRGGLEPDPTALHDAARVAAGEGDVVVGDELAWAAFAKRQDTSSALLAAWCRARGGTLEELLEAHAAAAAVAVDPWERATSAQQEASARWWAHDDLATARALLRPTDLPDGPWWRLLEAQGAMFDFLDGSIARGLAVVTAIGPSDEDHSRFVLALAHGLALALADRGEEAVAVAERARAEALAAREELYGNPDFHALAIVMGLMYEGRLDEAAGVTSLLYDEAVRRVEPNAVGWAAVFAGSIAFLQGDLERAGGHLAESEAAFLEALLPGVARWALAVHVLAAFARDDPAAGDAARQRLAAYRPDGFGLFAPLETLGDAWSALAAGRLDQARRLAVLAGQHAAEAGAWSHVGHIAHDLGRFGWWDEAVELLERMPSPGSALTRVRADYLEAGARDDGSGLDRASEAFLALGATLFAAEASACASAAHRRSGDRRRATAAGARMTALVATVPGAATPPLRLSGGADLTAREQEVTTMAASGRSNRDIATDLGITERTVENHLHRAFAKLGIGSRGQLRSALDAREALQRR